MQTIAFQRHGHGSNHVILLHDFLGDHRNYAPLLPYLDGDRFSLVTADLRGYGESRGLTGAYTAGEAAGDVLALADRLDWPRFHLVGHSMTALVVQQIALLAPERVQSLVCIAPVPPAGVPMPADQIAALRHMIDDEAQMIAGLSHIYGDRLWPRWPIIKAQAFRRAADTKAARGYLDMFTGTDLSQQVKQLRQPILCIAGAHDRGMYGPEATRAAYAAAYPHVQMIVCDNSGHYPMQEAPVFLASCLERFWASLTRVA